MGLHLFGPPLSDSPPIPTYFYWVKWRRVGWAWGEGGNEYCERSFYRLKGIEGKREGSIWVYVLAPVLRIQYW